MKVRLDKNKNIQNFKASSNNNSANIYIPLISGKDTNVTPLVTIGQTVYKGSLVAKSKGDMRVPIYSSASGVVTNFVEKTTTTGKAVMCIEIKNDTKESTKTNAFVKKSLNSYTKEEFIENIKNNGIVGLGGAGFPTYKKYEANNIKTLIVNAVECEPFLQTDEYMSNIKIEEILEAIDAIIEINNMEKALIVIKKNNLKAKESIESYIRTYPKIKLCFISDRYPSGWERIIIKEVLGVKYNKLPLEKAIVVNNISTIFAIYESLKYNKPLTERFITVSGLGIAKPFIVRARIGSVVTDIIKSVKIDDKIVISGGPMMGVEIDVNSIFTIECSGITILPKIKKCETNCLRCGLCVEACPVGLSPVLLVKSKYMHKKFSSKCIRCGLCTYICPADIDVRNKIIEKCGEL